MAEFYFLIYFRHAVRKGEIWSQAADTRNQGATERFFQFSTDRKGVTWLR